MDRTFLAATITFAALAIAGVALTLSPVGQGADAAALHSIGPALLGAGLAAFLVEALHWDRRRHPARG